MQGERAVLGELRQMRAYHVKNLAFALTALVALSVSNIAQSQDGIPGIDPLEGTAAFLDNEQDFRDASTSFEDGILSLEKVIFNEGLRRAIKDDEQYEGMSVEDALGEAARTLRICKDACQTPEERCRDRADRRSNTLFATFCDVRAGKCEVQCTQNLLNTVSNLRDLPPEDNEDSPMGQQKDEAIQAVLLQNLENARVAAREGTVALQKVALEEGIRRAFEEYENNGIPPGETQVKTAAENLLACRNEARRQEEECNEELDPDPESETLLESFLVTLACTSATILKELDCAEDLVERFDN